MLNLYLKLEGMLHIGIFQTGLHLDPSSDSVLNFQMAVLLSHIYYYID